LFLSFQDTGAVNEATAKPVIVCLHAIGHGSGDYAEVVKRLRARYRLIVLDWLGQGRSENSNTDRDFEPPSGAPNIVQPRQFVSYAGLRARTAENEAMFEQMRFDFKGYNPSMMDKIMARLFG
jgi:pimeloyl-ACP methyl ester carboxylesterase